MVCEYSHPDGFIAELLGRLEDDYRCFELLKRLRWPTGFVCPNCRNKKHYILKNGNLQCASKKCRYQCSLKARTAFHGSNLPIRKWFMAIFYMANNQGGVSAEGLKKLISVSTKTARRMLTRLREVMKSANAKRFIHAVYYGIKELIKVKGAATAKAAVLVHEQPQGPTKVYFADPDLFRNIPTTKKATENRRTALVVASSITHLTRFFMGTYHRFCRLKFALFVAEFVYRFNEPDPVVMIQRLLEDCVYIE